MLCSAPLGSPAQSRCLGSRGACSRSTHCPRSPNARASFPPHKPSASHGLACFLPQPGHPGGGWSSGLKSDPDREKPGRGLLQNSGHLLLPVWLVLSEGVNLPGSHVLLRPRRSLLSPSPWLRAVDITTSASLAFQNQRSQRSWRLACESDVSTEESTALKSTSCSINHPIFPDNSEVRLLVPPPFFSFVFF